MVLCGAEGVVESGGIINKVKLVMSQLLYTGIEAILQIFFYNINNYNRNFVIITDKCKFRFNTEFIEQVK